MLEKEKSTVLQRNKLLKMKWSQPKIWIAGAQANDENTQFEWKLIVARKPPFKKHYRLDGLCLT